MIGNLRDRVLDKIERLSIPEPNSGCQIWIGRWDRDTYGVMSTEGRRKRAHRVAYEVLCEPIPEGLVLDHLCRTPCCINPDHLEPVTQSENMRRGIFPASQNSKKTHCPQGHAYAGKNLSINRVGARVCRICKSAQVRAAQKRRRDKEAAFHVPTLSLAGGAVR